MYGEEESAPDAADQQPQAGGGVHHRVAHEFRHDQRRVDAQLLQPPRADGLEDELSRRGGGHGFRAHRCGPLVGCRCPRRWQRCQRVFDARMRSGPRRDGLPIADRHRRHEQGYVVPGARFRELRQDPEQGPEVLIVALTAKIDHDARRVLRRRMVDDRSDLRTSALPAETDDERAAVEIGGDLHAGHHARILTPYGRLPLSVNYPRQVVTNAGGSS